MNFSNQSVRYPHSPLTLEVTESEIAGKAWGESHPYKYPRHISICDAKLVTNEPSFISSTPVEVPPIETPIVNSKVTTERDGKFLVPHGEANNLHARRVQREQTRKMLMGIHPKTLLSYL